MGMYTRVYIYTYIYMYIHIYIYTHTHTHVHYLETKKLQCLIGQSDIFVWTLICLSEAYKWNLSASSVCMSDLLQTWLSCVLLCILWAEVCFHFVHTWSFIVLKPVKKLQCLIGQSDILVCRKFWLACQGHINETFLLVQFACPTCCKHGCPACFCAFCERRSVSIWCTLEALWYWSQWRNSNAW